MAFLIVGALFLGYAAGLLTGWLLLDKPKKRRRKR